MKTILAVILLVGISLAAKAEPCGDQTLKLVCTTSYVVNGGDANMTAPKTVSGKSVVATLSREPWDDSGSCKADVQVDDQQLSGYSFSATLTDAMYLYVSTAKDHVYQSPQVSLKINLNQ